MTFPSPHSWDTKICWPRLIRECIVYTAKVFIILKQLNVHSINQAHLIIIFVSVNKLCFYTILNAAKQTLNFQAKEYFFYKIPPINRIYSLYIHNNFVIKNYNFKKKIKCRYIDGKYIKYFIWLFIVIMYMHQLKGAVRAYPGVMSNRWMKFKLKLSFVFALQLRSWEIDAAISSPDSCGKITGYTEISSLEEKPLYKNKLKIIENPMAEQSNIFHKKSW